MLLSGDALVTLAARSLNRFGDLEADVVLPGHGDPWTGGAAEAGPQAASRLRG